MTIRSASIPAVLACCLVAACGSSAPGSPSVPKSAANVAVCKELKQVAAGQVSRQQLTGMIFESNAAITQRLRQDIGNYVAQLAQDAVGSAQQYLAKAQQDCGSAY
jgi:hypothetical protein